MRACLDVAHMDGTDRGQPEGSAQRAVLGEPDLKPGDCLVDCVRPVLRLLVGRKDVRAKCLVHDVTASAKAKPDDGPGTLCDVPKVAASSNMGMLNRFIRIRAESEKTAVCPQGTSLRPLCNLLAVSSNM